MNNLRPVYSKVISLLIVMQISLIGYSQMSSIGANYSDSTNYSPSDSIFVFCSDYNNAGNLIANDSSGIGGYDFEWFKYDTISKDFSILLNHTQPAITDLSSGGYKVKLTKGAIIQEYIAWVFNDTALSVNVNVIDPFDCELLELNAEIEYIKLFEYYDIFGTKYELENNDEDYNWTSAPDTDMPNYNYHYTSTNELPVEDVQYNVVLTDRFGCSVEDNIEYTAISTKADLQLEVFNETINDFESKDSAKGPAPLLVRFNNESINAYKYTLFFGDTLINNDIDTVYTEDYNKIFEHTYYYSEEFSGKKYYVKFISESEYGCLDSITKTVIVEPSELDVPNVFSPNNDGNGDNIFIIKDESIRTFNISIYSRSGNIVHEYNGDISEWNGWDGKVKGHANASEGVYFYVIEAKGWDNVKYREKGTVYLFR